MFMNDNEYITIRTIEQAITQILSPNFEPIFSEHSYGFRPGRRAEQAIVQILEDLNAERRVRWCEKAGFPALLDYYDDIHPWRTFSLNC